MCSSATTRVVILPSVPGVSCCRSRIWNGHCACAADGAFFIRRAMMLRNVVLLVVLVLSASLAVAQSRTPKTLDIYVMDVEGGNAVLFVAPSGESMLVDTGNGGDGAVRDAGRVMAA